MQQALWTYINAYDRRFGPEFFKQVPEQPGVYWMQDSKRSVLFVGKSSNLQKRLSSYRFINPQNCPKKLTQLIEDVRSLGWSPTATEEAAGLLEQQMVRRHPPLHGTALASNDRWVYVEFASQHPLIQFQISNARTPSSPGQSFGAFKNRSACQKCVSSMARLLWWLGHQGHFFDLPQPLAKPHSSTGQKVEIQLDPKSFQLLTQLVSEFWEGESQALIELFEDSLLTWCKRDPLSFFTKWVESDIETLKSFFNSGPARNRKIRSLFHLPSNQIEKDWIDDLLRLI